MQGEDARVIVVDDDIDSGQAVKDLLESMGYQAVVATNAEDGLKLIETYRPFCVVLDLGMPGVDGLELARRARAAQGSNTVLIALTGRTAPDQHAAAEEAGVDYVMVKPLDPAFFQRLLPPKD